MKNLKFFAMAALMIATIASCNKKEEVVDPTPGGDGGNGGTTVVTGDTPEVAAVEGSYVIVVKFDGEVCHDIVFPGSYKADENGWITAVDQIQKMEKIEGFEGWYKVVIAWDEETLSGKPVQLDSDGKFDWANQTGDADSWVVLSGEDYVSINPGYEGEADLTYTGKGQVVVLESKSWKAGASPCKAADLYDVAVTVKTPAIPADKKVYLTGDFDSWSGAGLELAPNADRTEWTGTLKQVPLNKNLKATLGSWDEDSMKYDEEKACWKGADNQTIDNIKYSFEVANFKSLLKPEEICK